MKHGDTSDRVQPRGRPRGSLDAWGLTRVLDFAHYVRPQGRSLILPKEPRFYPSREAL